MGALSSLTLGATLTATAFAGGSFGMLHGYRVLRSEHRASTGRPHLIAGAILAGVGLTSMLVSHSLYWAAGADTDAGVEGFCAAHDAPCTIQYREGTLGASLLVAAVGLGTLGYGLGERAAVRRYGAARHGLRVAPRLGTQSVGLAIAGRF